ncbi:MAG: sialate O-acetylesterase [Gemmatimonadaceae bacterium]|nr:sialate O-acetylesterase [Gemmatimonadaceae bacterium]
MLILKSCIGNRSLGWDLLPPGSERYEAEVTERGGQKVTKVFAGYKDRPDSWVMDKDKGKATEPPPWIDKKTGKAIEWYAGKQYDDDMANAKAALENLATIYPDYKGQGYGIAGFVWWQGHKDQNAVHAAHYEQNLKRLLPALAQGLQRPECEVRPRHGMRESPGARASACRSRKHSSPSPTPRSIRSSPAT